MSLRDTAGAQNGRLADHDESGARFALILGGGGARGFAHAGVLRALEHIGFMPSAIVGVSMGAVIGTAYSLRADWYDALLDFARFGLPRMGSRPTRRKERGRSKLKQLASGTKAMWDLGRGWLHPCERTRRLDALHRRRQVALLPTQGGRS
jgi:NTE family protein